MLYAVVCVSLCCLSTGHCIACARRVSARSVNNKTKTFIYVLSFYLCMSCRALTMRSIKYQLASTGSSIELNFFLYKQQKSCCSTFASCDFLIPTTDFRETRSDVFTSARHSRCNNFQSIQQSSYLASQDLLWD